MKLINKARQDIVSLIRSGEKKEQTFGGEFEHFIVNRTTLESYDYYEPNGIKSILLKMRNLGWQSSDSDDVIMTLKKDKSIITLEPGGQIELSIMPCHCIDNMAQYYKDFINDLKSTLEPEQAVVSIGYHPKSSVKDIPFIPKERYKEMAAYFNTTGIYAHNMMKGTASTQVAIDFESEEDCRDKFRLFNALSPFIGIFFDTAPYFEGGVVKEHAMRMQIWEKTDSDRSGVCIAAFDDHFKYSTYADLVLDIAPILVLEGDGVKATGKLKLKEALDQIEYSEDQLIHVMTMLFPDVRLKHFIEVRMADAMPYPLNIGFVEFIKTIAYTPDIYSEYVAWAKTVNFKEIRNLKLSAIQEGINARLNGVTIYDFMHNLMEKVIKVNPNSIYLKQLKETYDKQTTFAKRLTKLDQSELLKKIEVTFNE